jgi:hypothetical protein
VHFLSLDSPREFCDRFPDNKVGELILRVALGVVVLPLTFVRLVRVSLQRMAGGG